MAEQREEELPQLQQQQEQQNVRRSVYRQANHGLQLNNIRQNDEFCDVTVKVNEREFRAHRVILAAGLRYFHTLFTSDFQERSQSTINITSVSEENMEAFIAFAYTGEIHLTDDNVLSLLEDSDYLNQDDVKDACVRFLVGNIRPRMAFQILHYAHAIDCPALKDAAKRAILENFAEISHTEAFLELPFHLLRYLLDSEEVFDAAEPAEYFERLVQWLVRDLPDRRAHAEELLRCIYVVQLTAGYLMGYLYESVDPEQDVIIRDIVTFYRRCREGLVYRRERAPRNKSLITIDRAMLSHVQLYDFVTNTWTLRYLNVDHVHYTVSAVLKNKLYVIGGRTDVRCVAKVRAFDPLTNAVSGVSPMSVARRDCAACASSNHLIVCGGRGDDGLALSLVERYDPGTNAWETLAPMNVARYGAAVIVFRGCVYAIGGSTSEGEELNVVERYDLASGQWSVVEAMGNPRTSHAVAVLNGKLYACGGWDKDSVEVYDPRLSRWLECPSMGKKRDSLVVVSYNEKLVAVGGDNDRAFPSVETYDPTTRQWAMQAHRGLHNKYITGGFVIM